MIFVTVGTTMPFDSLLEEVDRLAGEGFFAEPVVFQTGQSRYEPKNGEFFKFRPTLDDLIAEASLIINHGGATTIELMKAGKPFLAVPNPVGSGDHQTGFLTAMGKRYGIVWTPDVKEIAALYEHARKRPYTPPSEPNLAEVITHYLDKK